ncbi:MAG: TIGR03792 family protein [Synechococcaceae cyanobacterium SM2_3_1]|nr:TIGR03792 family protein [Synechococcaceae cyanobacterium SM2_3_1]
MDPATEFQSQPSPSTVAVEVLCFQVPPGGQQAFIEQDETIWSRTLAQCPGFLRKEVWLDPDNTEHVTLVIYWANREDWQAFPQERMEELDRQMRPYVVKLERCQEFILSRSVTGTLSFPGSLPAPGSNPSYCEDDSRISRARGKEVG